MRESDILVATPRIQGIGLFVVARPDVCYPLMTEGCLCVKRTPMLTMYRILDAESLQMTFDPSILAYTTLLEFFYKMHDPTTLNRQGMDSGTQYRSAIFTYTPEQESQAKEITQKAQEQWWKGKQITTEILPAGQWWDAEDYHQLYLHNNPGGYECPAHYVRGFGKLE